MPRFSSDVQQCRQKRPFGYLLTVLVIALSVSALFYKIFHVDPSDYFPPQLKFSDLVRYDEDFGFRENCIFVEYKLHPDMIASLQQNGKAALSGDFTPPSGSQGNPFSGWIDTPMIKYDNSPIHALGATNGCDYNRSSPTFSADKSLATLGNYFMITANREGLILVDVTFGIAIFLYFG